MSKTSVKALIDAVVKANGNGDITGTNLNGVLTAILNETGGGGGGEDDSKVLKIDDAELTMSQLGFTSLLDITKHGLIIVMSGDGEISCRILPSTDEAGRWLYEWAEGWRVTTPLWEFPFDSDVPFSDFMTYLDDNSSPVASLDDITSQQANVYIFNPSTSTTTELKQAYNQKKVVAMIDGNELLFASVIEKNGLYVTFARVTDDPLMQARAYWYAQGLWRYAETDIADWNSVLSSLSQKADASALALKADKMTTHTHEVDSSIALIANCYNELDRALDGEFVEFTNGYSKTDEYVLKFSTLSEPIIVWSNVESWVGGEPTIEGSKTYLVSIQDGIGIITEV